MKKNYTLTRRFISFCTTNNIRLIAGVFLWLLHFTSYAQSCGVVYGAGYNGAGSSVGVRNYDYATNTWGTSSLINTALFLAPNTINTGGPLAIDPLNQFINIATDATAPRRIALLNFASSSLTVVNYPAALNTAITQQPICSGYKPASHVCYYMTLNFLKTSPVTPAGTAFYSIDFSVPATPTYKIYTPTLSAGSPLVNTAAGGDLCFDASGIGYLVTAAKQLYRIVTDETANTVTVSYLANLSALTFAPTAVAFNPVNNKLTLTGATQIFSEYDLANNTVTLLTNTAGFIAPDLASCFFPNVSPALQVTKTVYDVTQAKAPPVTVITNDIIEYTITIKNTGNVNAGNFTVTDPVPAGTTYQAGTTTMNGVAVADVAGAFPFATARSATSSDQAVNRGILTTNATSGSPVCTIKYRVKITAASGVMVTNTANVSIAGLLPTTPITANGVASFNVNVVLLPVTFTTFTTTKHKTEVSLNWATSNETNVKGFEVERSKDGDYFETIGFIAAYSNTGMANLYSFTDKMPNSGNDYYRIKEIDFDGNSTYSAVKTVLFKDGNDWVLSLYPNPLSPSTLLFFNLKKAGYTNFCIINAAGSVLRSFQVFGHQGLNKIQLASYAGALPAGTYYIWAKTEKETAVEKFTVPVTL
jgi:uncharacterized repeat protein (TIGR01451 family)